MSKFAPPLSIQKMSGEAQNVFGEAHKVFEKTDTCNVRGVPLFTIGVSANHIQINHAH